MLDPTGKTIYYDIHLVRALKSQGVEVRFLTARFVHEKSVPDADTHADYFFFRLLEPVAHILKRRAILRWLARLIVYYLDLIRFFRIIRREDPDVLHIQWTLFPLIDRWLFRLFLGHIPIVLTVHNPLVRPSLLAKLDDMISFVALSDAVIVHGIQNVKMLSTRLTIQTFEAHSVQHGPLFEDVSEVEQATARRVLDLPMDRKLVMFFGIIKPYKGIYDLIDALSQLLAAESSIDLVIAGSPQEDFSVYREYIARLGLEAHVHCFIRYIESDEVPYFFAAADVVCLPYRQASQSGVLLSAYRFGCPVVVTSVGALPESVEHGENGYLVPPEDPAALAKALEDILSDDARLKRFGEASRRLAKTRFGWDKAAADTIEIYQRIIMQEKAD